MEFDVFNGDADGICALLQLRFAQPLDATLITGVKRDIQLLDRVLAREGDQVTVLDISLKKNSAALQRLLSAGASVFYVDHHDPGEIPEHPGLKALIDTSASTCTSLLVDQYLEGQYRLWAIVAAFGDNMAQSAMQVAQTVSLDAAGLEQLQQLGICINYNGYGSEVADLHFPPDVLYRALSHYPSPLDFMADSQSVYRPLLEGYQQDMAQAGQIKPLVERPHIAVYQLPDAAWARRVSGVFGNALANRAAGRAHAVLTSRPDGGYTVSVRAPLNNLDHASELCSQFPSGGGRKGAAGINHLPESELERFIALFDTMYRG